MSPALCIRLGSTENPWLCHQSCTHFHVGAASHCALRVADGATLGGMLRVDVARSLGLALHEVKGAKESALAKVGRRMRRLGMVAPHG